MSGMYIFIKTERTLHEIEFPFNDRILRAWSIRHENKDNKKGLYPSVLENLISEMK